MSSYTNFTYQEPAIVPVLAQFVPTLSVESSSSLALVLFQYSHYVNVVASLVLFLKMVFFTPTILRCGQRKRYGQLIGFGFLSVALQSYHCVSSLVREDLTQVLSTMGPTVFNIVLFNVAFATLTWPLRITQKYPTMKGAEKFFSALAILTSVGMMPALILGQ